MGKFVLEGKVISGSNIGEESIYTKIISYTFRRQDSFQISTETIFNSSFIRNDR
jgi:hypothetical protein